MFKKQQKEAIAPIRYVFLEQFHALKFFSVKVINYIRFKLCIMLEILRLSSQFLPVNPYWHLQVYDSDDDPSLIQTPPLRHGAEIQGSPAPKT